MAAKPKTERAFVVAKRSRLSLRFFACHTMHAHYLGKEKEMKKVLTVLALCLSVSATSFGAEHVVTRSAKAAGKGTYKAAKVSVKETGKVLKFLF